MSGFSRREVFGSLCAGALGILALGRQRAQAAVAQPHIPAADIASLAGRKNKTRLYQLYLAKSTEVIGWPYQKYDHVSRAKVFKERLNGISDIEWAGGEIIETAEGIPDLKGKIEDCDGLVVVVLTSPARGLEPLTKMGLKTPTLVFNDLFCGDCSFLGFQKRAAESGMKLVSLSSEDLGLLERKIQLLRTAARLRRSKIICFADRDREDTAFFQGAKDNLGIEIIQMGSKEINPLFEKADRAEAKRIAETWVKMADKVVEPSFDNIVDSARMYMAIKQLMDQEKANAATMDCLTMVYGKKISSYPCLAFVQLNDDGYVGACEADLPSTLTMLLVGLLADRPGFISDPVLDTEAGLIYHAHCVAATRMAGLSAVREHYNIRTHSEDRSGVSVEVKFTPGPIITAAKYVPFDRMLVSTGEIVGNKVTDLACRSKMVTLVPKEGIRKMLDNYSGGLHRVIFYGDHVEDLKDLGKLLNFSVVEETRV